MENITFIKQEAEKVFDEVLTIYHALHRIPELSLQEYKTTQFIKEQLKAMSIEPISLDETGCVAYIGPAPGEKHGVEGEGEPDENRIRTIALRADIDGLPVKEETNCSFASCHEGKMHACGHDGHTAALLGAAKVLKSMESSLPVRVKLIFQAAEENTEGARRLIQLGVLDDVDEIFGLHLFSDIPTGIISIEEGPRMAQTDRFLVRFKGKGGHAAKPHLTVDATVMAAAFVLDLQTLVSRETNPTEGAVATIGSFHSGNQYNVVSEEAVLEGTCRSYSGEISKKLEEGICRKADGIAFSYRGKAEVNYAVACHPPVCNDKELTGRISGTARMMFEKERFQPVRPLMLGEDFSWYQTRVPGTFALVGCGKPGEPVYQNHNGRFAIYEPILLDTILLHLCAVLSSDED